LIKLNRHQRTSTLQQGCGERALAGADLDNRLVSQWLECVNDALDDS
jgi:hypothetical protein